MSTAAIDTSRTSEMLSAFVSEIGADEPVDNIFVKLALSDYLLKNRESKKSGRQMLIPLDTAQNGSFQEFDGQDSFDVSVPDTARSAVYAMKNYGGALVFTWEEMEEVGDDQHRIFDLVKHRRKNLLSSGRDYLNADFFATSIANKKANALPVICSVDRSLGGIDSTTSTYWDAQETTSVGAFASAGLSNMRTMSNNILQASGKKPDIVVTTQSVMEALENELDADVRYSQSSVLARGSDVLKWKGAEVLMDDDCPSGHMYFLQSDNIKLRVSQSADFKFGEVREHYTQYVFAAKMVVRLQLYSPQPRGLGRLTGIT